MSRRTWWTAAGFVGLAALPAHSWAQTHSGPILGAGYTVVREIGGSSATYKSGWVVDIATAPRSLFSWVGEVGANYRTPAGVKQTLSSYQGGARVTPMTGNVVAFVQVLAGVERYSEPGFHERGFALQPGGGVDFLISGRYSARGQVDYRLVKVGKTSSFPAATFKELRAVIGIAIGLGK